MQGFMSREVIGADQVVLDPHVRTASAALQVKEVQHVIGAACECPVSAVVLLFPAEAVLGLFRANGCHHQIIDGRSMQYACARILVVVDNNFAGSKIDLQVLGAVDAAHVADQDAVDIDPDVVVSCELIDHFLIDAVGIQHHTVHRDGEL